MLQKYQFWFLRVWFIAILALALAAGNISHYSNLAPTAIEWTEVAGGGVSILGDCGGSGGQGNC